MADDFEPDPDAVGPAIMAWYALHDALKGDPAEIVAWAADAIATRLGAFGSGVANPLTPGQASVAIGDARLLLGMIAEIFGRSELPADDEAALAFQAELKRRRGRPAQSQLMPQSLAWWGHAKEVEALIEVGDMQKVAVGKVATRLGLKDAVVAGWCRDRRKALEQWERRFGDMDKSAN
jgi:hypothetical protein